MITHPLVWSSVRRHVHSIRWYVWIFSWGPTCPTVGMCSPSSGGLHVQANRWFNRVMPDGSLMRRMVVEWGILRQVISWGTSTHRFEELDICLKTIPFSYRCILLRIFFWQNSIEEFKLCGIKYFMTRSTTFHILCSLRNKNLK